MKLYHHQQALVDKNPAKHLIAHSTGTGKTHTALALASKNATRALIIVPKALTANWKRNLALWPPLGHQIISKETFRRDWDRLPAFQAVIVDECHHFSGMSSQMSKSLSSYLKKHQPRFVWLLSATPLTSTAWSVYRLASFLGHNWNYQAFKHRFFFEVRLGHRVVPAPRKGMDGELAALIRSIGDVVALEECADVPDQVFETEYFTLTKEQIKAIKDLDDATHIARFTKHHQIEQGCKKGDGYVPHETYPSMKNERILELCAENPKVAVFCRYLLQIETLAALIKDRPVFILSGEVKDRDAVVQQVEATSKCAVLIQSDTSEGYELPSIPLIIFASLSFSYLKYQQAIGRFNRINALKKNVYIHLVTEDGPDQAIYDCIQNRADFYVELYNQW